MKDAVMSILAVGLDMLSSLESNSFFQDIHPTLESFIHFVSVEVVVIVSNVSHSVVP